LGLAAAAGLAEGLAAETGLAGAVVGLAGAVVAAGAVVGLGAPPVWQALTNNANADAPAASKRKLRIWVQLLSRLAQGRVEVVGVSHPPVHSNRSRRELQAGHLLSAVRPER
jgi:hypothetical protein